MYVHYIGQYFFLQVGKTDRIILKKIFVLYCGNRGHERIISQQPHGFVDIYMYATYVRI